MKIKQRTKYKIILMTLSVLSVALITITTFMTINSLNTISKVKHDEKVVSAIEAEGGLTSVLQEIELKTANLIDYEKDMEELKQSNENTKNEIAKIQVQYDNISEINENIKNKDTESMTTSLNKKYEDLSAKYKNLNEEYKILINKYEPKQNVEQDEGKVAYLTFDDGVSSNTIKILNTLKKYKIKATFFPNWHSGNDEIYKRIIEDGHTLGNHTYSHDWDLVYKNPTSFKKEVSTLNDKITSITGVTPTVFRFPGGSSNTKYNYRTESAFKDTVKGERKMIYLAIDILKDFDMQYFDWNVDSGDASSSTPLPASKIVSNVINEAGSKNSIIVLMHDTSSKRTTAEALPQIIEGLEKKGYTFKALSNTSYSYQFVK